MEATRVRPSRYGLYLCIRHFESCMPAALAFSAIGAASRSHGVVYRTRERKNARCRLTKGVVAKMRCPGLENNCTWNDGILFCRRVMLACDDVAASTNNMPDMGDSIAHHAILC